MIADVILCFQTAVASEQQKFLSQAENELPENRDNTMEDMKKMIQSIKEDNESVQKYNQEMEKIKQLKPMFDELGWIIDKNSAYIKDWNTNYDCIVGKKSASIIDNDIEHLQNQLDKIKNDCQQADPVEQPNFYKLCQEKTALLTDTIEDYKKIRDEFRAKCKSK
jgi:hypothetical protein